MVTLDLRPITKKNDPTDKKHNLFTVVIYPSIFTFFSFNEKFRISYRTHGVSTVVSVFLSKSKKYKVVFEHYLNNGNKRPW